jgi:ElaB/YqjD/DUF883 family membrane-anchored ribosome-binding protein
MNDRMRSDLQQSQERLAQDMRAVVGDAEALLRAAGHEASEGAAEARSRLEESLHAAREAITRLERSARDQVRAAGRATDDYVHENPWRSIALGAAAGLLVGVIIGRR